MRNGQDIPVAEIGGQDRDRKNVRATAKGNVMGPPMLRRNGSGRRPRANNCTTRLGWAGKSAGRTHNASARTAATLPRVSSRSRAPLAIVSRS